MKSELKTLLAERGALVEERLDLLLSRQDDDFSPLIDAARYSCLGGGKRIRAFLTTEFSSLGKGNPDSALTYAACIEMVHAASLIHDDLPCMDDDDMRRGKPSCHIAYPEETALLAGDALMIYPYEIISTLSGVSDKEKLAAIKALSSASGMYGMIGGQTADIEAERQNTLTTEQLLFIHEHKTAALIQASMMVGAILAGASEEEVATVEKCAYNIGIAFQIQDDILDVIGDSSELGKQVGSDAQNHKQTYVTLNGLEKSSEDVIRLSEEALKMIGEFKGEHSFLEKLVRELIHRRK